MTSPGNRWRLNEIGFTKLHLRQRLAPTLPETLPETLSETFQHLPDRTTDNTRRRRWQSRLQSIAILLSRMVACLSNETLNIAA